jgi:hypothetical protein
MTQELGAPTAQPTIAVTPVKRLKGGSFADARRLQAGDRVAKPSRRGVGSAFADGLMAAGAGAALMIAAFVTLYVVLAISHAALPFALPRLKDDLLGNLIVSSLFFWLEVVAIVIGMRLLDRRSARRLAARQLFSIQVFVATLINGIEDERYAFAVKLDENLQDDGRYTTDFGLLNIGINRYKNEFIERIYCDVELTDTASHIVGRLLRLLDLFSNDTYELSIRADAMNKDTPTALVDCLNDMFDRTRTGGLRDIEDMLGRIRDRI